MVFIPKYGMTQRRIPNKPAAYFDAKSAMRKEIKRLMAEGKTYQEIAEILGSTRSAVSAQAKRMGLQQRKGF